MTHINLVDCGGDSLKGWKKHASALQVSKMSRHAFRRISSAAHSCRTSLPASVRICARRLAHTRSAANAQILYHQMRLLAS